MNRLLHISAISVLTLACAQLHAQDILRISRIVMAQQVDSSPAADYPEDAKAAGIEGTVALDVVISPKGIVEQVQVISGPDKLREAAKAAVSKWTYKPYKIDDGAREVDTTVLIEFSFKDSSTSRNASGDAVETVTDANVAPPASVPEPSAKPAGPVRVPFAKIADYILNREDPEIPSKAAIAHLSGAVVIRAIISKSGAIESITVVSGDDVFRQACIDAVKKSKFKPYLLGGVPTKIETTIAFTFDTINNPSAKYTNGDPGPPPIGSGGFGPH